MSDEKFQQESDHPAIGKSLVVAAFAFLAFIVGVTCFVALLRHDQRTLRDGQPPVAATEIGKPEIGIVIQRLFDVDRRTPDRMEAQEEHLGSYGFIDRERGIIHIPIDEAMRQIVVESAKR